MSRTCSLTGAAQPRPCAGAGYTLMHISISSANVKDGSRTHSLEAPFHGSW